MLSSLGATARAPIAVEGRLSVLGDQVLLVGFHSQMPPCAAPRMNVPSLRIASAPMRPLCAANALSLRWTWTIGFGPRGDQLPEKVVGPEGGGVFSTLAWSAAALRRGTARSAASGAPPARGPPM